jgi:hypothetical protein
MAIVTTLVGTAAAEGTLAAPWSKVDVSLSPPALLKKLGGAKAKKGQCPAPAYTYVTAGLCWGLIDLGASVLLIRYATFDAAKAATDAWGDPIYRLGETDETRAAWIVRGDKGLLLASLSGDGTITFEPIEPLRDLLAELKKMVGEDPNGVAKLIGKRTLLARCDGDEYCDFRARPTELGGSAGGVIYFDTQHRAVSAGANVGTDSLEAGVKRLEGLFGAATKRTCRADGQMETQYTFANEPGVMVDSSGPHAMQVCVGACAVCAK